MLSGESPSWALRSGRSFQIIHSQILEKGTREQGTLQTAESDFELKATLTCSTSTRYLDVAKIPADPKIIEIMIEN